MKKVTVLSACLLAASAVFLGYVEYQEQESSRNEVPVISADSDTLEVTCDYTEEDLLQGITAVDQEDGNLTDQVIVEAPSRFISKGESAVEYVVFDSASQPGVYERKVIFTDYQSPRIFLDAPLVFDKEDAYFDLIYNSIHIVDSMDGDITDWIQYVDSDVNYGTKGSYTFEVSVINSFGDTIDLALPVHLQDQSTLPYEIVLTDTILYLASGQTPDPLDYLDTVTDRSGNAAADLAGQVEAEIQTSDDDSILEIHYTLMKDDALAGETYLTLITE